MKNTRIYNRNYLCRFCGKMRRAPGIIPDGDQVAPSCCGYEMGVLSYEQTVAVGRLSQGGRTDWIKGGRKIEKRRGRRGWRAIG